MILGLSRQRLIRAHVFCYEKEIVVNNYNNKNGLNFAKERLSNKNAFSERRRIFLLINQC